MLNPLYTAVSWVLLRWHALLDFLGLNPDGGFTWSLSIVLLVVTARLLLFRFFIKQVHHQRRMQEMQPRIKKLQEKHKGGDKAALQREMMALQRDEGFNPISGCLPMFLQLPIFISLFHVLKHMSAAVNVDYPYAKTLLYGFTHDETLSAAKAKLFGQAPLAASLHESSAKIALLGGDVSTTRIVTLTLVIVSAVATFITQRAVMANQTTPAEGQAATIQKLMLVGIPLSVLFSGFIFPLGVLLYWFTSNLWTMGQQFYIFRFHPHVPAAKTQGAPVQPPKAVAPKVGQKPAAKGGRPGPSTASALGPETATAGQPDLRSDTDRPAGQPKQAASRRNNGAVSSAVVLKKSSVTEQSSPARNGSTAQPSAGKASAGNSSAAKSAGANSPAAKSAAGKPVAKPQPGARPAPRKKRR